MIRWSIFFLAWLFCFGFVELNHGALQKRPHPRPGMKSPKQRMMEYQQRETRINQQKNIPNNHFKRKNNNNNNNNNNSVTIGGTIYVNGAKSSNGDGKSWNTAYNNLQSALTGASAETQIWVAQGTYTPSDTSGDTTSTFTLSKNNLYLYGGFKGDETNADQRDPEQYVTILSGKIDDTTQSAHIITVSGPSTYIDGFTISDGDAIGSNDGSKSCSDCFGAGIYFHNPSANTISNEISNDHNINNNNDFYNITNIQDKPNRKILNWIEEHSSSKDGLNEGYYLTVSNCIFSDNKAIVGGAIFAYAKITVSVSDCTFNGNVAQSSNYHASGGGAIYVSVQSSLSIADSTFTANTAGNRGAAVYVDYGVDLTVSGSTFSQNRVENGHGGAIYMTDRCSNGDTTEAVIRTNTFDHNEANGYGGAVFFYYDCLATLVGNTFTFNTAGLAGGAVANYNAYMGFVDTRNQFMDNSAPTDENYYEADFPFFGEVADKYTDFTPYMEILGMYYDESEEPPSRPIIIYVDNTVEVSENGNNDGLTWDGAVATITEGISLAEYYGSDMCEIWVRGNTGVNYMPTKVPYWYDFTAEYFDAEKSKLIDITQNIIMFGGFDGSETERSQRDFEANPTQISGIVGDTPEDMTYQVLRMGKNSRIDGFIVSDASGYESMLGEKYMNDNNLPLNFRNAYKNQKIKPQFDIYKKWPTNNNHNNDNNVGSSSSSTDQLHSMTPNRGNGIMANATNIRIYNTLIINNYGNLGAGLYVLYHKVYGNNILFVNNVGEYRGGAIQVDVNGNFECKNCQFEDNITGRKGGAIYLDYVSQLTLSGDNCKFNDNYAYDGGGAIGNDGGSIVTTTCTSLEFNDNWSFQDGGAVYEGSYGWNTATPNRFKIDSNSIVSFDGNQVFDGMGNSDYFMWNYDYVQE